jgi:hypothetical protein
MKKLLAIIMLAVLSTAYAGGEEKKVCTDVVGKDGKVVTNKDGTTKQTCKTIKVHKKVEGEAVPEKK